MSARPTMVEPTARRRSHGNQCGNALVEVWFLGVWVRLATKDAEKQAVVILPWTQVEIRVTVTVTDVGYLTED